MDRYRIKPGQKVKLKDFDPGDKGDWQDRKKESKAEVLKLNQALSNLQELLFASQKHRLLVVFQAMDTGGKDGTIRAVFEGVNPQGVRVANFKTPTPLELAHDYLWRVHTQVPGKGELVIFNRSHYEDVLVVRVHNLVPPEVWKKRYQQINEFERMLVEEGTTILKFYLHIDAEEQRDRLIERIDNPRKQWKFNPGDLEERKLWDQYMKAFEDVLEKTSTPYAPWYVVPSNANWYRNLVVGSLIVNTMEGFKMKYPQPVENIAQYKDTLLSGDKATSDQATGT
ncbi:MAG: polyphosphate kinase 2 family protein [Anaerolineaceae bacterium]|nr:polyphosphate kinase 2 family protein [Anaerolineaceae bacterium]